VEGWRVREGEQQLVKLLDASTVEEDSEDVSQSNSHRHESCQQNFLNQVVEQVQRILKPYKGIACVGQLVFPPVWVGCWLKPYLKHLAWRRQALAVTKTSK
jgi:hypothetical protein